jgi:hypothetical protein
MKHPATIWMAKNVQTLTFFKSQFYPKKIVLQQGTVFFLLTFHSNRQFYLGEE